MGLPMYVSPPTPKRQLPSKQPTSPPYTPQAEESFEEPFQNSRISSFDITDFEPPQRSQRSRRSSSLPYNLVQQHIHRLHQLHHLHRTREQQMTSNLASRRGLNSAHHLSLNRAQMQHAATIQARRQDRNLANETSFEPARNIREERLDDPHDEIIDFPFDDFTSSFDNNNSRSNGAILVDGDGVQRNNNDNNNTSNNNNQSNNDNDNNNNNSHHRPSSIALDNVIRRVNLLRQISQQQDARSMRPSSRHHRSSTGHSSSGRSSRIASHNVNVGQRRDDLIQRGIDIPPTLLYEYNTPLPPIPRLSAWHTRRGVNWSAADPQRTDRRSSFADDFYSTSEISHQYESDDHHLSRILSPIPRRFDARLVSLPIRSDHELLDSGNNNRSNVDTEPRGSASGGVC